VPFGAISGLAYDISNNIMFVSDYTNEKVYSIEMETEGNVQVVAGTGNSGYTGDGSQGIFAELNKPINVFFSEKKGYLFISDFFNSSLRYLNLFNSTPITMLATTTYPRPEYYIITTSTLDEIQIRQRSSTSLALTNVVVIPRTPSAIATVEYYSNLNISAFYLDSLTNKMYYSIGNTIHSYYNSISSVVARVSDTGNVTCITRYENNLYICDKSNHCVYKIDSNTNQISIYINSSQTANWNGDGKSPANTKLSSPTWIAFNNKGLLYISDTGNFCIRRIGTFGNFETVVGNDIKDALNRNIQASVTALYATEQDATKTLLNQPTGFTFDLNDNLIFCDSGTNAVYSVNSNARLNLVCGKAPTGTPATWTFLEKNITTDLIVNGVLANTISLNTPSHVAVDSKNSIYVTSKNGHQIAKITQKAQDQTNAIKYTVTVFSGFGTASSGGYSSSDLFAQYALLNKPSAIQYIGGTGINGGLFYFLDGINSIATTESWNALRYISPPIVDTYSKGLEGVVLYSPISIIANYSQNTYNTGVDLSIDSKTEEPLASMNNFKASALCVDDQGNIYIANIMRKNILKIDTGGKVTSLLSGLNNPTGISIYNNSILYISDTGNNRIIQYNLARDTYLCFYDGDALNAYGNPTVNAIYLIGYLFTLHPLHQKITVFSLKNHIKTPISPTDSSDTTITIPPVTVPNIWDSSPTYNSNVSFVSNTSVSASRPLTSIGTVFSQNSISTYNNYYDKDVSLSFTVTMQPGFNIFVGLYKTKMNLVGYTMPANPNNIFNAWAGLYFSSSASGITVKRYNDNNLISSDFIIPKLPLTTGTFTIVYEYTGISTAYYYNGFLIFRRFHGWNSPFPNNLFLGISINTGEVNNISFTSGVRIQETIWNNQIHN